MTVAQIGAFALAMTMFALLPGPGVFAVVAQSLSRGFSSAIPLFLGMVLGDLCYLLLAVFGLGAIARLMGDFFCVVRILGAFYLIWIGIGIWKRDSSVAKPSQIHGKMPSPGRRFLGGFFLCLGNPKVILFYMGFLPAYMDLSVIGPMDVMVVAALVASVLTTVLSGYALFAHGIRQRMQGTNAMAGIQKSAGALMIGSGIAVALRKG